MKILITWIGPWLDKGEAAMLISMQHDLLRKVPNANITALASSFDPSEIDIKKYGEYGIKILPGIYPGIISRMPEFKRIKNKSIRSAISVLYIFSQFCANIFNIFLYKYINFNLEMSNLINRETVKEYKNADYIIFCGGQNITNMNMNLFVAFFEIMLSKILRKRVMIWANSLGPFKPGYVRPLVKLFLDRVDLITTREATSKLLLDDLGIKAPSFVTADAAFTLQSIPPDEAMSLIKREMRFFESQILIGITVIDWKFPGENDPAKKMELYLAAIAETAEYIINKYDAHILFFPQVIIPNIKDDRQISNRVFNKIKNKSRVTLLTLDYSPEQIKGMYGCMSLLIGTRFHSCILAQSMHVPTIAIEYEGHKARGIMTLLELDKYVCDINTISSCELISKVDEIWNERDDIKYKLEKNIKIMNGESTENLNLALKYLFLKDSMDDLY